MALPDFMADGGFHLQFPTGNQAKLDFVTNRAADPPLVGDARDSRKAHSRGAANDFQNFRNGIDTLNRVNIGLTYAVHTNSTNAS